MMEYAATKSNAPIAAAPNVESVGMLAGGLVKMKACDELPGPAKGLSEV